MSHKIDFSSEQIAQMVRLRKNRWSYSAIGKEFGCDKGPIIRTIKEHAPELSAMRIAKFQLDETYFDNINSSIKAYWLGFIAADGCVSYNKSCTNGTISIVLNEKDQEHLRLFLKDIGSDSQVYYVQGTGFSENKSTMAKVSVYSKHMADALNIHGVPPKKSLILEPPKIDSRFYMDFIRGYFDGDGSIYTLKNTSGYVSYHISFVGTKEILEWILNCLGYSDTCLYQRKKTEKNTYYFRFGGRGKPQSILRKFYANPERSLDRKNQLVQKLLSQSFKSETV